ncbi:MAG: formylglycine-generating enzyme family protein, partial [Chloroflexi bacterium]|nr:formylglycine-generating enzyme family protein [Chloroflexota bacterium]
AQPGVRRLRDRERCEHAAARGRDGRAYPWGKEYRTGYANIDETDGNVGPNYLQTTSVVGMYPQGQSPYGVLDMSGNVWEWCANEYQTPANVGLSGTANRVLRGGSWILSQDLACCSSRFWNPPGARPYYIGFRVVVRLAPVS